MPRRKKEDFDFSDPFQEMAPLAVDPPRPGRNVLTSESPDPETYIDEPLTAAEQELEERVLDETAAADWDPFFVTDRVLYFCESLTEIRGFKFFKYQEEFARRVIYSLVVNDGEEITALFSRQSGKTEAICDVIIGCSLLLPALAKVYPQQLDLYDQGLWTGVFAPVDWLVQTDVERMQGRLHCETTQDIMQDPELQVREVTKFRFSNKSRIFHHTANPQTYIESKTLHLLIIEEAQDADKMVVQKSLHPMCAATNGSIVKIGTSNTKKCEFLDAIKRNRRRQRKHKGWWKKTHFEFNYLICQRFNPRYKRFIEKEKERLGEDSDAFRMSYGLEWILERGMFVAPVELDAIEDRKRDAVRSFTEAFGNKGPLTQTVAGLDIGKSQDSTVLTIGLPHWQTRSAEGFFDTDILAWFEWLGDDHESQYHQIVPLLREFHVRRLAVDSTGVGDAVTDRYHHNLPDVEVLRTVFSSPTKSDLYKMLDREIRGRRISVPAAVNTRKTRVYKHWRGQMEDLEKEYRGAYLKVQAPKDDPDAHDDFADSMALLVHAAYANIMPEVEETMSSLLRFGGRGRNAFLR